MMVNAMESEKKLQTGKKRGGEGRGHCLYFISTKKNGGAASHEPSMLVVNWVTTVICPLNVM